MFFMYISMTYKYYFMYKLNLCVIYRLLCYRFRLVSRCRFIRDFKSTKCISLQNKAYYWDINGASLQINSRDISFSILKTTSFKASLMHALCARTQFSNELLFHTTEFRLLVISQYYCDFPVRKILVDVKPSIPRLSKFY